MAARGSLNKVMLIGNLTRDPELRYTPQGAAVCSFSVATNRSWMPAEGGERREETEFHRIVAWNKLGELCSQLLTKGRKVYVEGRLQTRSWQTADGQNRQTTEIVITDMNLLDSRKAYEAGGSSAGGPGEYVPETASSGGVDDYSQLEDVTVEELDETPVEVVDEGSAETEKTTKEPKAKKPDVEEADDDLPF